MMMVMKIMKMVAEFYLESTMILLVIVYKCESKQNCLCVLFDLIYKVMLTPPPPPAYSWISV